MRVVSRLVLFLTLGLGFGTSGTTPAIAAEPLVRVSFSNAAGQAETRMGRVLIEATDGGLLLEDASRRLWAITAESKPTKTVTEKTFQPHTAEELGKELLAEFGDGFEIVQTKHYVICTNAGKPYAEWCGGLFERLLSAFLTHWRTKPLTLETPKTPLPAIIFSSAEEFATYAAKDATPATAQSKGYYSVRTNRIVLYDLTAGPNREPARTRADVWKKIATSAFNVATVVHEATHQMAFNCGMHTRYADNPVWLTEGMAMYFETPDLRNRTGWRTIGQVNRLRLRTFKASLAKRRSPDSLVSLIASDQRLTNPATAESAYAEAWALNYFLIKKRRKSLTDYLHRLSEKSPLVWDTPETRLKEFREAFGDDLSQFDREFLRYMSRLR